MKKVFQLPFGVLLLLLIVSNVYAAQSSADPVSVMADIMLKLHHYPSESEKNQLQGIINNTDSADIKEIASALKNMRHTVGNEDMTKLEEISNNDSVPQNVRTLSNVLMGIHHMPDKSQKKILSSLIH